MREKLLNSPIRWISAPILAGLCVSCASIPDDNVVIGGNAGVIEGAESAEIANYAQKILAVRSKSILSRDGLQFRDANGDLALNPYEDWRLSNEQRADDLIAQMNLAEKVGTLMHSTLPMGDRANPQASAYDFGALSPLIDEKFVTSFITRLSSPPAQFARANNQVQELAESQRLGIPVTISTDPRNHFQYVAGATSSPAGNSQWPELLGFAALESPELVRQFAEIARKEYRAVGIHMTLSPQVDLATEPRWSRNSGTLGSNAMLTSALGGAYVTGFQGSGQGLTQDGVIAVAKHFVGYGAQPEGFDAHNYYGRFAQPGDAFPQHVEAFAGAIEAGAVGIMPAYTILQDIELEGVPLEQVSPGYSRQILQGLLRDELGFGGYVLSDWAITRDCNERCLNPSEDNPQGWPDVATPWGVEDLTVQQRYIKAMNAGMDQFGGTDDVAPLIAAVETGALSMARIDQSVRRILIPKFQQGLFENPYVDEARAAVIVGNAADLALAQETQEQAHVLLQGGGQLPLAKGAKLWLFGMDEQAVRDAGFEIVEDVTQADLAIIRTSTPFERLHPHHTFGRIQNEGRLDFQTGNPAYDALVEANSHVPVAFSIFLDRPAILTNVIDKAQIVLGNFGANDAALLAVLTGEAEALGRLPFALARSIEQVEAQDIGRPNDIADPLFQRGFREQ